MNEFSVARAGTPHGWQPTILHQGSEKHQHCQWSLSLGKNCRARHPHYEAIMSSSIQDPLPSSKTGPHVTMICVTQILMTFQTAKMPVQWPWLCLASAPQPPPPPPPRLLLPTPHNHRHHHWHLDDGLCWGRQAGLWCWGQSLATGHHWPNSSPGLKGPANT